MSSFFSYFKIFLLCMLLSACASNSDFHPHLENSQNAYVYLNHSTANLAIFTQTKQQQIYQKFLAHYYSPWTNKFIFPNLQVIKTDSENDIKQFKNNPGWNTNNHLHSKQWIATVIDNMQMSHFPNHLQPAITVQNTNERVFPTDTPSFTSLDAPGLA